MIPLEFEHLRREIEARLSGGICWRGIGPVPAVDIYETEREVLVIADLPGVPAARLDVAFSDQWLVIRGERADPCPRGGVVAHRVDIAPGAFELRIRIPVAVEADAAQARSIDGVVSVALPRRASASDR